MVRRVRTGARKLESFRSFERQNNVSVKPLRAKPPHQITIQMLHYTIPHEMNGRIKGDSPSAANVGNVFLGINLREITHSALSVTFNIAN